MNGRRRKDEPFNPFAPNASQKARDRKDKSHRPPARQRTPEPVKPTNDLAAKQKAAMEALRKRKEVENERSTTKKEKKEEDLAPKHKTSPQPKPAPKTTIKKPESREDRLASLRAKSAATARFAKDAQDAKKSVDSVEVEEIHPDETITVAETELVVELPIPEKAKKEIQNPKNVFKTIKTEKKKVDRKPKRRRGDKKGGGRQPQSRKLDRRKYLEYKYAARELLDIDEISEEHRSNILGQIWAKGERIGVSEAVEFIDQKEAELIIPENVADEFRKMVKRYTTKR